MAKGIEINIKIICSQRFAGMKTTNSIVRKYKDVLDPKTNEPMKIVMWPPTKQTKEIPIVQYYQDGSLDNMNFGHSMRPQPQHGSTFHMVSTVLLTRRISKGSGNGTYTPWLTIKLSANLSFWSRLPRILQERSLQLLKSKMWLLAMVKSDVLLIEKD